MDLSANELHKLLDEETYRQCGHEERKGQLSMSWLHLPEEEIIDKVLNGCAMDDRSKLKLYQGTYAERGIRERLSSLLNSTSLLCTQPKVLTAYDGRLTGHTDGSIDDALVEIKSVPDEYALAQTRSKGKLPFKVFCQINAYMLWGKYKRAFVIYESREEGLHWVSEHYPNNNCQRDLIAKVETVLLLLKKEAA